MKKCVNGWNMPGTENETRTLLGEEGCECDVVVDTLEREYTEELSDADETEEKFGEVSGKEESDDASAESLDETPWQEEAEVEEDDVFDEKVWQEDISDKAMGDAFHDYLIEIGKIPLLTKEEEQELGRKIKNGGPDAEEARHKMAQANLRLVVHCAKKFKGYGVDMEDLNAMGIEGLYKAIDKFDCDLGNRFSTYAIWWINQAIGRAIAAEGGTVKIPNRQSETIRKIGKAQKTLLAKNGEEPTVAQIATFTGLSEERVLAAFQSMITIVSLEAERGEDGDTTLQDMLEDRNAVDPCEAAVQSGLMEDIRAALGQLDPRTALVLKFRYGIGTDRIMTLEEIASLPGFNVTRERIRQIESKGLRMLKRCRNLYSYLEDFAG